MSQHVSARFKTSLALAERTINALSRDGVKIKEDTCAELE